MTIVILPDVEDLAKAWLLTTSVAALVTNKIFLATPKGSPLPCVTLSRVGGGLTNNDQPTDSARIRFQCFAAGRPQAKAIAKALVSEADSLALNGGYTASDGKLQVAEVVLNMYLADPVSDTPKYIIDVRFQATPV